MFFFVFLQCLKKQSAVILCTLTCILMSSVLIEPQVDHKHARAIGGVKVRSGLLLPIKS